jgi:hypothetical protein
MPMPRHTARKMYYRETSQLARERADLGKVHRIKKTSEWRT